MDRNPLGPLSEKAIQLLRMAADDERLDGGYINFNREGKVCVAGGTDVIPIGSPYRARLEYMEAARELDENQLVISIDEGVYRITLRGFEFLDIQHLDE